MSPFLPRESSRNVARTSPSVPGSPLSGICISRVHFSPTATGPRASIAGISPKMCLSSLLGSASSTISIAPSVDTRTRTRFDCIVRRRRSSSEAAEAGVMATESVTDCISVPPEVHCCAIARVKTSIEVVIEPVLTSRPPRLVVPVISTDCERCILSVSPMCGRIWSRTGCASAVWARKPTARRTRRPLPKPIRRPLKPVGIVFRSRLNASRQRSQCRLRGDRLPELGDEVRLDVVGTRQKCGISGANHLVLRVKGGDLLHPGERDCRIERSQRAQDRGVQRDVARLRVTLRALAPLHYRRTREPNENRLREMWMANHQLPFLQRCQLCSSRRAQHRVARRRELVGIHPAEKRRSRIADDSPVHLRAELLRAEQNEAEVAAALRDVEQHLPDVGVGTIPWRVLVELVDKNDEVLDAQVPPLQVLAELRDDASEDEVLRIFLEVCDIDYVHRAVLKAPERQVADGSRVGDESGAAGGDVRQPVSNLADRRHVMRAPALSVLLFHPLEHIAEPGVEIGKRLNSVLLAQKRVGELLVHDVLNDEVDQRIGLRIDVVPVEKDLCKLQDLAQAPREWRHVVKQSLVVPEGVESQTLRRVGREIPDALEWLGLDAKLFIESLVRFFDLSRLVQVAEVGTFDVEAHRRDRPFLSRKMLEQRSEQPLHGARFRRQPRDARDVEVGSLGSEQKIRVE